MPLILPLPRLPVSPCSFGLRPGVDSPHPEIPPWTDVQGPGERKACPHRFLTDHGEGDDMTMAAPTSGDVLVLDYLATLWAVGDDLPPEVRDDLLTTVSGYIAARRDLAGDPSQALARLGPPDQLVAAVRRSGTPTHLRLPAAPGPLPPSAPARTDPPSTSTAAGLPPSTPAAGQPPFSPTAASLQASAPTAAGLPPFSPAAVSMPPFSPASAGMMSSGSASTGPTQPGLNSAGPLPSGLPPGSPPRAAGGSERAAIGLLIGGAFVLPGVAPAAAMLIAGRSPAWNHTDKTAAWLLAAGPVTGLFLLITLTTGVSVLSGAAMLALYLALTAGSVAAGLTLRRSL